VADKLAGKANVGDLGIDGKIQLQYLR